MAPGNIVRKEDFSRGDPKGKGIWSDSGNWKVKRKGASVLERKIDSDQGGGEMSRDPRSGNEAQGDIHSSSLGKLEIGLPGCQVEGGSH